MGEVYRARDPDLGRDVAIKLLPEDAIVGPERLARFEREAKLLAALNHPHIVTIFSVEEADDVRFLTMELVEGKTLSKVIPRSGLPLSRFLQIAIPLAAPRRVHVDAFGHVHVCQGVSLGNVWQTPLSGLVSRYDASTHPICGPLSQDGPRELARAHGVELDGEFVDECHYHFLVRRGLVDRFPEHLAPSQVSGLET